MKLPSRFLTGERAYIMFPPNELRCTNGLKWSATIYKNQGDEEASSKFNYKRKKREVSSSHKFRFMVLFYFFLAVRY